MTGNIFQFAWEVRLIEWLQQLVSLFPFLEYVFEAMTFFGEPAVPVLIGGVYYLGLDKEKGRKLFLNIITAQIFANEIKNIVKRIRPYFANESIECLRPASIGEDAQDMHLQGYSFPSGHVTLVATMACFFAKEVKNKKLNIFWSIILVLTCISRFALGVHYPTDVMAGAVIGVLGSLIVFYLYDHYGEKYAFLFALAVAVPGFFFATTKDFHSVTGILLGFYFGDLYEKRYVKFRSTDNLFEAFLRVLGAGAVLLAISSLIKMILGPVSMDNTWLLRCYYIFRYGLATFVCVGFYPYLFRYLHFSKKKEA